MSDDPLHQAAGPDRTWTTVNTAEALPGVLTPLGWTFWADPCELGMRACFYDIGVLRRGEVVAASSVDERFSGAFLGRYTANVNELRRMADRMPGTDGNAIEEQLLGAVRSGLRSKKSYDRYPVVAVKMPRVAAGLPKRLARQRREVDAWWHQATSPAALEDVAGAPARFAEARKRFEGVMRPHAAATMLAQATYEQVRALAEKAGLEGLETSLITGYGEMEETRLTAELWDVSRDRMALEDFVARHGYHGPSEGALSSRSWRESDRPLRSLVETYRTMSDDADPHAAARARREQRLTAERRLLDALPLRRRLAARAVLRLARRHVPLREVGKASFLQCIDVARAAARTCGAQLAARGELEQADDVFYLTADEVEGEAPPRAGKLVQERRALREQHLQTRLPDAWTGQPEAVTLPDPDAERADEVEGLGVSPGVVEGRARVVEDPEAGIDLEPDEVLVCETTDPSWASYFMVASALVIDIGGPVSHGAIVARELGVPCVINTRSGTQAIGTGDLLRVDGGAGVVAVLERAGDDGGAPATKTSTTTDDEPREKERGMANELSVLQTVRLKGRTTPEDVGRATGTSEQEAQTTLAELVDGGTVEEAKDRFRLTPAGKERLTELLDGERAEVDGDELHELYEEFTPLNSEFKELVTDWQQREGEPNDHEDADYDAQVIDRLATLHERFGPLLGRMVAAAPRLGPYPERFEAALKRVRDGEQKWLTAPMIDSYHTVWFELHEDLIGLAGLSREAEAAGGRAE